MSKDQQRRRQERAERQRLRRQSRRPPSTEVRPIGDTHMPGFFGWVQRSGRLFYLTGILIMVLSLGAFFVGANLGAPAPDVEDPAAEAAEDDEDEDAEATETPDATETPEATATPEEDEVVRQYDAAPAFSIDPARRYTAVLRTEKGDITVELLPDAAPEAVNSFVFLARNRFYDGLTFHRVLEDFVAQAGDPSATSAGDVGYTLPQDENDLPLEAGMLAMAKSDESSRVTDGAQFFITLEPQPGLEPNFTPFGRVVEGMEVVEALTLRDPQLPGQPPGDLIIEVEIIEEPATDAGDGAAGDGATGDGAAGDAAVEDGAVEEGAEPDAATD